jgi:replicative DNA helicase
MYLDLRKLLGKSDDTNFVPHLVLGRVSKDLSNQEYMNISRDLSRVAKELNVSKLTFC